MFKNDIILDAVEALGKNVGKLLKSEKDDSDEMVIENLTGKDILILSIKKLTHDKKYNEAEDVLFEALKKYDKEDIKKSGDWFYKYLLQRTDEELEENNFPRVEVLQGMNDLNKLLQ